MTFYDDLQSSLSSLGYQDGFTDLLGIVRSGNAVVPYDTDQPSQLTLQDIMAVSDFSLGISQSSVSEEVYAGEGPDPSVLSVGVLRFKGSATLPLFSTTAGFVDPLIANLYDIVRWSYWGTPRSAVGGLTEVAGPGATALITNNVSEFTALPLPFTVTLGDGNETIETITVESVDKSTYTLNLATPVQYLHNVPSQISARLSVSGAGPDREPSFSLMSWREGMISPCLVNKMKIEANIDEPIKISVEFSALNVFRDRQINFASTVQSLQSQYALSPPRRIVNSIEATLSPASANSGNYGLLTAIGDPLFAGYQALTLDPMTVKGFSITIDNQLEEVYGLHSLAMGGQRFRENARPLALVSKGRKVEGELKLLTALSAWGAVERLAGPSALAGGGLIVDFSVCSLTLPELAWEPVSASSTADSPLTKTLKWTLVADSRNALPELLFSIQE